jgi:hypothetical protein
VAIDPVGGQIRVYADGALIIDSGPFPTLAPGGYARLEVGIPYATNPQGPLTVFVDDVIAGTQRIGCN